MTHFVWSALIVAYAACQLSTADEVAASRIGSGTLRTFAIEAPLPEYPSRLAAKHREGKVVIQILLEPDGMVSDVEVLEFSHPAMGAAVTTALKQWTFRPVKRLDGSGVRGTESLAFISVSRTAGPS